MITANVNEPNLLWPLPGFIPKRSLCSLRNWSQSQARNASKASTGTKKLHTCPTVGERPQEGWTGPRVVRSPWPVSLAGARGLHCPGVPGEAAVTPPPHVAKGGADGRAVTSPSSWPCRIATSSEIVSTQTSFPPARPNSYYTCPWLEYLALVIPVPEDSETPPSPQTNQGSGSSPPPPPQSCPHRSAPWFSLSEVPRLDAIMIVYAASHVHSQTHRSLVRTPFLALESPPGPVADLPSGWAFCWEQAQGRLYLTLDLKCSLMLCHCRGDTYLFELVISLSCWEAVGLIISFFLHLPFLFWRSLQWSGEDRFYLTCLEYILSLYLGYRVFQQVWDMIGLECCCSPRRLCSHFRSVNMLNVCIFHLLALSYCALVYFFAVQWRIF